MATRGRQPNISFFAFTATPKYKTLEVFGRPGFDGKPEPFHLYSMRQAIEENFILDVLQHYTTYKTYYRLIKFIEDDPKVGKRKAGRALARFMSLHPYNIAQKTEVMVEHFRHFTMHKIGGKAKAMVVTSSRLHAVSYKQAFDQYISEKGYKGIKTLVAFSGTVIDPDSPGLEYTEVGMNGGIKEKELPERFGTDEYQVLLVAEKYQTTFDHAQMNVCIDPAVNRYREFEEEVREEFRKTLVAYRNLYAFLAQIIPFQDSDLERLYSYIRFLLTKLPRGDRGPVYNFDDEVALKFYRLQKISEGSIDLEPGKQVPISGPTDVGTGTSTGVEIFTLDLPMESEEKSHCILQAHRSISG
jgi:hypothetical protein